MNDEREMRLEAATGSRLPVTVVLPVLNEEQNLPAALASVEWADEVVVVDSGSTDRTVEQAAEAGATVLQFAYDGRGLRKKAWALANIEPRNPWVLLLDADERVPPALRDEIVEAIERDDRDGWYLDRELVFMGRRLRCFSPNWNLRLFRKGRGHIEDLGLASLEGTGDNEIHEHVEVEGELGFLKTPLVHADDRGLTAWVDRHNRYATWEAHLYRRFRSEPIGVSVLGFFRLDPFRRKRALRRLWVRMPFRPLLRFLVWYVPRRGFLDGRPGFTFCVLMAYYEFVIGVKLREIERGAPG
jgi:glycosyltransferase involved in cell wall biosynthesis